jgi:hypothetical protein
MPFSDNFTAIPSVFPEGLPERVYPFRVEVYEEFHEVEY